MTRRHIDLATFALCLITLQVGLYAAIPAPPPLEPEVRAQIDADAVLQAAGVSYALRIASEANGLTADDCAALRDRLSTPLAVLTLNAEAPEVQANLREALGKLRKIPVEDLTLELRHALEVIQERGEPPK